MSEYCSKLVLKEINNNHMASRCIACRSIIAGAGGGGDHICTTCHHTLYSGILRQQFRDAMPREEDK